MLPVDTSQLPDTPVVTPERTPRGSPVYSSPLQSRGDLPPPPLPTTPDLTPQDSLASPPPRRQRSALTQTPRDDTDDEESSHGETAYRKAIGEGQDSKYGILVGVSWYGARFLSKGFLVLCEVS